jgi:sugar phosphate isomerase/epimerase
MLRLSVNELTTYRWSFDEDVTNYAEAGITQMGIWRQKLSDYGEAEGIELMRDYGLSASSLLWAGGFTGSDGRSHRDAIEDGVEAIELAAQLHADCLVVYTGGRGGHTRTHARRLVQAALEELAAYANDFGVTLAIEPMHPACGMNWTFLTSLAATLEFLDHLNTDSVKIVLDTYHVGLECGLLQRLPGLVPKIGLVHLGDARRAPQREQDRCLLGRGNVPIHDIVAGLHDSGYEGPYELELMGLEIEDYDYWELLSDSRRVVESLIGAGIGQ